MKIRINIILMLLLTATTATAALREEKKEFHVNFRVNSSQIDPARGDNGAQLAVMDSLLWAVERGDAATLDSIVISGWASPEGPKSFNEQLSKRRRQAMRNYLALHHPNLIDKVVDGVADIAWEPLIEAVETCVEPWRNEVLDILYDAPAPGKPDTRNARLKRLQGGTLWPKLIQNYYAPLRNSASAVFTIYFEDTVEDIPGVFEPELTDSVATEPEIVEVFEEITDTVVAPRKKPFYMSLSSNMLYDAALIPNVGFDIYLGKNFSVMGNWHYAWWSNRGLARYWRTYGGYIGARYWFGNKAHEKPLQGHHLGVYAQALLYDFELGGKGYLSGTPGKNIFHRPTVGAGIEYGYSLPVGRHLNIDFNIGVGYLTGRYIEYEPKDGHFVPTTTKNRRYFGPTKLEVSLVWLLGRGNVNQQKGGAL